MEIVNEFLVGMYLSVLMELNSQLKWFKENSDNLSLGTFLSTKILDDILRKIF